MFPNRRDSAGDGANACRQSELTHWHNRLLLLVPCPAYEVDDGNDRLKGDTQTQ